MNRPGIIVAARETSSRFPGKALASFGGTTVLGACLERCRATGLSVVVAIPDTRQNDKLARWLGKHHPGLPVFRGSEDQVLARVVHAAMRHGVDPVIRVTGDCVQPEPALILQMLGSHLQMRRDCTSNVYPERTFTKGLDVEIVRRRVLVQLLDLDLTAAEQEHVTLGVYGRNHFGWTVHSYPNNGWPDETSEPLCVDTPEDLVRLTNRRKVA